MKKMEYFDDCPICQAIKKADEEGRVMSLAELKALFKTAKEQGMAVGGEWFDQDSDE